MPLAGENELSAISKDPQALIRAPIGAMSPLWGLFAGAAVSGAAWWWMTRWARPANLEALFGAAEAGSAEAVAKTQALAESAAAAVAEAVLPAAEDLVEAAPRAVGGESAPISPVLEALAPEIAAPAAKRATAAKSAPAQRAKKH